MERSCEPMDKNRIEGVAWQGERAWNRKALVIEGLGGVNPAVVQSRSAFLPGEICVSWKRGTSECRSIRRQKSAEAIVIRFIGRRAEH